jgi:DNA-binding NarL/FixJ family response regulator
MPDIDGRTMALAMLERVPSTRVIYMSGYSDPSAGANTAPLGPDSILIQKPFRLETLVAAVRRILEVDDIAPATRPKR